MTVENQENAFSRREFHKKVLEYTAKGSFPVYLGYKLLGCSKKQESQGDLENTLENFDHDGPEETVRKYHEFMHTVETPRDFQVQLRNFYTEDRYKRVKEGVVSYEGLKLMKSIKYKILESKQYEEDEAAVKVLAIGPDGRENKFRYWLVRKNGKWLIDD